MRKFKVTFVKMTKVLGSQAQIQQFAEQIYFSDSDKIEMQVPPGFAPVAVIEYLPDVNQTEMFKLTLKKNDNTNGN